jgi:hypothetical protein
MKKGKNKKKCADGGQINPWEQYPFGNPMEQYIPQWEPINVQANPIQVTPSTPPVNNPTATNTSSPTSAGGGMKFPMQAVGDFAKGIGQAVSGVVQGGIPLLNALIPEDRNRYTLPSYNANTQFQMGQGTQAIYEDGGNLRRRKKNNIVVEEDFTPASGGYTPYSPQEMRSLGDPVELNYQSNTPAQQHVHFESIFNPNGSLAYYSPQFENFSRNEAIQEMQQLPQEFNGVPVQTSPETYSDLYTNFWLENQSNAWNPTTQFENGGGIHIDPKNKGKFTAWANAHNMGVQEAANHILANKEEYSSKLVKRANFAKNFGGKKKNGGFIEGQSYDLTSEQIQYLLSSGYQFDI